MRILRVIGGLDPKFGGPSISATKSIFACLDNPNNEIDLIVPSSCAHEENNDFLLLLDELTKRGVKVHSRTLTSCWGGLSKKFGISIPLFKWISANIDNYDVIHCHSAWVAPSFYAIIQAKRKNIPVVLTTHESLTNYDIQSSKNYLTRLLKKILKNILIQKVNAFIFSSELESIDSFDVPNNKRYVVFHPVIESALNFSEKQLIQSTKGQVKIGYLGRLHPKKNIELILDALLLLPDNYSLLLAGSGETTYESSLLKLIKKNKLSDRVELLGWLKGEQKEDFFNRITLLVMPSDYECFGNSGAEAMCFGMPVIVSKDTGITPIVHKFKAGLVVAKNAADVAVGIQIVVKDEKEYSEMCKNAIRASKDCFAYSAHEKAVSKIYTNLP